MFCASLSSRVALRKTQNVGRSEFRLRQIEAALAQAERVRAQRILQTGSGLRDSGVGQGAHVRGPP